MQTIKVINNSKYPLPKFETNGAAAMDVVTIDDVLISTNKITMIDTGLNFKLPDAHKLLVLPRSGFAKKYGLTVVNSPGLIDEDYCGRIKILLTIIGQPNDFTLPVEAGTRIAQIILEPVTRWKWEEVNELPKTERNEGGFGSTGK